MLLHLLRWDIRRTICRATCHLLRTKAQEKALLTMTDDLLLRMLDEMYYLLSWILRICNHWSHLCETRPRHVYRPLISGTTSTPLLQEPVNIHFCARVLDRQMLSNIPTTSCSHPQPSSLNINAEANPDTPANLPANLPAKPNHVRPPRPQPLRTQPMDRHHLPPHPLHVPNL